VFENLMFCFLRGDGFSENANIHFPRGNLNLLLILIFNIKNCSI
jgi:hypothetical protein